MKKIKFVNGQLDSRRIYDILAMPEENEKIECGYGQEHAREGTHSYDLASTNSVLILLQFRVGNRNSSIVPSS